MGRKLPVNSARTFSRKAGFADSQMCSVSTLFALDCSSFISDYQL